MSSQISSFGRLSLCVLVLLFPLLPAAGQDDLSAARDNVLAHGKSLPFAVCRAKIIGNCESGILSLSLKEVSFEAANGQKLFTVAPSDVTSITVQENLDYRDVSIELRIGDKGFSLDPFPTGGSCNMGGHLRCSPEGIKEEMEIADYIAGAIPRLADGELALDPSDSGANR